MPNWQTIAVFCFAIATTLYFKVFMPETDRGDTGFDEQDTRIDRLKRYRMEHGACIYCGEPLALRVITMTYPVCDHCGPDV